MALSLNKLKKREQLLFDNNFAKPKKKAKRFDGLTEEEINTNNTLPDYLVENLDVVFVGINPSLMAAHRGRYYAGPGNHFYKLLYESGLIPRFVDSDEDAKLLDYGIGLTNIVERATRSSADLSRDELKQGSKVAREKLKQFKPKIAVFNGKCIYDAFASITAKSKFNFGLQPGKVGETSIWVVPSSSARCANFPRMTDKLHFYTGLKKYLGHLRGETIPDVDLTEFVYESKPKIEPTTSIMWRRKSASAFQSGGRVANKGTLGMDTTDEDISNRSLDCVKDPEEFPESEKLNGACSKFFGSNEESQEPKEVPVDSKREESTNDSTGKSRSNNSENSLAFFNLIKRRVSEKKEVGEMNDTTDDEILKIKPKKKLKSCRN